MKKLFLLAAIAVCSVAVNAQVWVSGNVGFNRDTKNNVTSFQVAPQVGYQLSDKWDIALELGYNHSYNGDFKTNSFDVMPFVRYSFFKSGIVTLFADGMVGFGTSKTDIDGAEATNDFGVGLRPGLKVDVTEKFAFVATCGYVGYHQATNDGETVAENVGFNVNATNLTFGLVYKF